MTEIKKIHLTSAEVMEKTGLSIDRIYLLASKGKFPKYINGQFKFSESHIQKLLDLHKKFRSFKKTKAKTGVSANKSEIARIKREIAELHKHTSQKLKALKKDLSRVLSEE